jgi:hypothetical protein
MEATFMKRIGIGSTALMLLLFGATYSFAQDKPDQHEEDNTATHDAKPAKAAEPAKQEEKAPPAKQEEKAQPAEKAKPEETAKRAEPAKTAKPAEGAAKTEQPKAVARTDQAHNFGGKGGGHIADAKFSASFGSSHHFHMNRPTMYEGYSRFNYGGYYFGFYDPWPSGWGYSDDVYVDYIGGQYYLIDPEHPGPRLMINVVI